ncbi:hypothetical protein B566_EDAN016435 [Ephemera danica]|nr:hypothetical protein B566_EDAN016435 [Ephemera danica]
MQFNDTRNNSPFLARINGKFYKLESCDPSAQNMYSWPAQLPQRSEGSPPPRFIGNPVAAGLLVPTGSMGVNSHSVPMPPRTHRKQHSATGDAPAAELERIREMKKQETAEDHAQKKPSMYDKLKQRKTNASFIKKLSAQEITELSLELQERCYNFSGQPDDFLHLKNIISGVLAELPNKLTTESGLKTHKTDLQNSFLVLVTRQRRKEKEVTEEPGPTATSDAYTMIANIGKRILYQNKNMRFQPPRSVEEVQMVIRLMEKNVADLHSLNLSDSDESSLSSREDYLVLCNDALEHLSVEMKRIQRDGDKRDTPTPPDHCTGNVPHAVSRHAVAHPPLMPYTPNQYYYQPSPSLYPPPFPNLYQNNTMQFHMMQRQLAVQAQMAAQAQLAAQQAHATYMHYHQNLQAMMQFAGGNVGIEKSDHVQIDEVESPVEEKNESKLTPEHEEIAKSADHNLQNSPDVCAALETPVTFQIDENESPVEEKNESNLTPEHEEIANSADHNLQNCPDICVALETPVTTADAASTESNSLHGESELLLGEVVETEVENDLKNCETLVHELEQKTMGFWGPLENLPPLQDAVVKLKTNVLCNKACGPDEAASLVEKLEHCQQLLLHRVEMMESALKSTDSDDDEFCSVNSKDSEQAMNEKMYHGDVTQNSKLEGRKDLLDSSSDSDEDVLLSTAKPTEEPVENIAASIKHEEDDCSEIIRDNDEVGMDESMDLPAGNLDGPDNQETQLVEDSSDDIQRMANMPQVGQMFQSIRGVGLFVPPAHFVWQPQPQRFFGPTQTPWMHVDPHWPSQPTPTFQAAAVSSGFLNIPTPFRSDPASQPGTMHNAISAWPITGQQATNMQAHGPTVVQPANYKYTECMRNPPQPITLVTRQLQEPLTASVLAAVPPMEQKQMLGERLFPLIQRMYPELVGKITGMLLEMDNCELLSLLEDHESFKAKVEEAVAVWQAHQVK